MRCFTLLAAGNPRSGSRWTQEIACKVLIVPFPMREEVSIHLMEIGCLVLKPELPKSLLSLLFFPFSAP
jgi:hypothetical protein